MLDFMWLERFRAHKPVSWLAHHFDPHWNILTTFRWIIMNFSTDIQVSRRRDCNDFVDLLTFPSVPDQTFNLFCEISQHLQYQSNIWTQLPISLTFQTFGRYSMYVMDEMSTKFCANIHRSQTIYSTDPAGWQFWFSYYWKDFY